MEFKPRKLRNDNLRNAPVFEQTFNNQNLKQPNDTDVLNKCLKNVIRYGYPVDPDIDKEIKTTPVIIDNICYDPEYIRQLVVKGNLDKKFSKEAINKIRNLPTIQKLLPTEIDLSGQNLTNIKLKKYFDSNENKTIKKLDLSNNNLFSLEGIPQYLFDVLEELYLNGNVNNLINSQGFNLTGINNFKNLKILNLSYNKINILSNDFPISLEKLELTNNNISSISSIIRLINLKELLLNNNNITLDVKFEFNVGLRMLDLSKNNITSMENHFDKLKNSLEELNLSDNKIQELIDLNEFYNLQVLILTNNKIKNLTPIDTYQTGFLFKKTITIKREKILPPRIRYLNISNNYLKNLDIGDIPDSLVTLDISFNDFRSLPAFFGNISLIYISSDMKNLFFTKDNTVKVRGNNSSIIVEIVTKPSYFSIFLK